MNKTVRFPSNITSWTRNAVLPEHLEDHIKHNKLNRFGQSLFVDDVCVYQSYCHSDSEIERLAEISKGIKMPEHNLPYN